VVIDKRGALMVRLVLSFDDGSAEDCDGNGRLHFLSLIPAVCSSEILFEIFTMNSVWTHPTYGAVFILISSSVSRHSIPRLR
jgi:hypothetical protein